MPASPALNSFMIKQLTVQVRNCDVSIQGMIGQLKPHFKVLSNTQGWDARDLLEMFTKYYAESNEIEHEIDRLYKEAEAVSRRVGTKPPQSTGVGKFDPSLGGDLANLRGSLGKLRKRLADVRTILVSFGNYAKQQMDNPRRTPGDKLPTEPISLAIKLILTILQIVQGTHTILKKHKLA
jgi:hypothetical protein